MKYKNLAGVLLASVVVVGVGSALAAQPAITLVFSDPQGLCKNHSGNTQFSFNDQYLASGNIEFYSGPVMVNNPQETLAVPLPPDDGVQHNYLDFEITSMGDCGDMELDYEHLGACYNTNLIPAANQGQPYSYKITLTPQATGNHTYGNDMYNLSCAVAAN